MLTLHGLRTEAVAGLIENNAYLKSTILSVSWVNDRTMPTEELLLSASPAIVIFTGTIDNEKKATMRSAVNTTLPNAYVFFAPEEHGEIISDG